MLRLNFEIATGLRTNNYLRGAVEMLTFIQKERRSQRDSPTIDEEIEEVAVRIQISRQSARGCMVYFNNNSLDNAPCVTLRLAPALGKILKTSSRRRERFGQA